MKVISLLCQVFYFVQKKFFNIDFFFHINFEQFVVLKGWLTWVSNPLSVTRLNGYQPTLDRLAKIHNLKSSRWP